MGEQTGWDEPVAKPNPRGECQESHDLSMMTESSVPSALFVTMWLPGPLLSQGRPMLMCSFLLVEEN